MNHMIMLNANQPLPPPLPERVYILWGENFSEKVVSIFTTECRYVGLNVKIVGLTSQKASGVHGLALYPDMLLSEALDQTEPTGAIVLACSGATAQRIANDPRVPALFKRGVQDNATFVVNTVDILHYVVPTANEIPSENVIAYRDVDNVIDLARELAARLSGLPVCSMQNSWPPVLSRPLYG